MKRLLIYIPTVIVALFITSIICLKYFCNPKSIAGYATKELSVALNRKVSIDDVKLKFFPWPGVSINNVTIDNPQNFKAKQVPYLAHIGEANVSLQFWPLLHGRLLPKSIKLQDSSIYLAQKNSLSNWQFDLKSTKTTKSNATKHMQTASSNHNRHSAALNLRFFPVNISQASIHWINFTTGKKVVLHNWSLKVRPNNNYQANMTSKLQVSFNHRTLPLSLAMLATVNPQQQLIELKKLRFNVAGIQLAGNLIRQKDQVRGYLTTNQFSLRKQLQNLSITLPGKPSAWKKFRLATHFKANQHQVRLDTLALNLDSTKLTGNGDLTLSPNLSFNSRLLIDKIDADNYLPNHTHSKKTKSTHTTGHANKEDTQKAMLALNNLLSKIDWHSTLQINNFVIHGLHYTDVQLDTHNQSGITQLRLKQAKLNDGTLSAQANINMNGPQPTFHVAFNAKSIDLQSLFNNLYQLNKFSGLLDIDADIDTQGQYKQQWLRNLMGRGRLTVNKATVKGYNLQDMMDTAIAKLKKQPAPAESQIKQTQFDKFYANYNIQKGVAQSNLQMSAPHLDINGNGSVNLVQSMIDYHLKTKYQNRGKTWAIPLVMQGPIKTAKMQVDFQALLKMYLKNNVKKAIDNKLKQLLPKGLFKHGGF